MNTGRPVFSAKVHGHGSGVILMYDTTRYMCRPPLGNASTLPGCLFQERRIHEMSCLAFKENAANEAVLLLLADRR